MITGLMEPLEIGIRAVWILTAGSKVDRSSRILVCCEAAVAFA